MFAPGCQGEATVPITFACDSQVRESASR